MTLVASLDSAPPHMEFIFLIFNFSTMMASLTCICLISPREWRDLEAAQEVELGREEVQHRHPLTPPMSPPQRSCQLPWLEEDRMAQTSPARLVLARPPLPSPGPEVRLEAEQQVRLRTPLVMSL